MRGKDDALRVLMTADAIGGVWTYCLELAGALSKYGVRIALAVMGSPPTPEQVRQTEEIGNFELFESACKLEWMQDPWEDVERAGAWLLQLEQDFRPHVIHLNGYVHAALPWRAPTLVVGHSCVASWWNAVRRDPLPAGWQRNCSAVRQGLAAADLVCAPTRTMLGSLETHYGELGPSLVIPNGRQAELFPISKKEPLLFAAGRIWDEAKNLAVLEQVAQKISWPIHIAGGTEHPEGGKVSMQDVHLLGHLSSKEIAEWYSRSAIYVFPARYEPFGLSVLEAALAGCALVLGDIPTLRESWQGAACFVPPDDTDKLGKVLHSLIKDRGLRNSFQYKAQARAMRFSVEKMAAAYLCAYRSLAAKRRSNRLPIGESPI